MIVVSAKAVSLLPGVPGFAEVPEGVSPIVFLPIQNQQPSEEHTAQVGEMGYVVRRQSGYRTQSGKKFDKRIYNNEYARTYGDGYEKDIHRYVGVEPPEGEQDTKYGTGSTDGIEETGVVAERSGVIRQTHVSEHQRPHHLLHQGGTQTADEVVDQETPLAPFVLYHRSEHPHGKHVKKEVAEVRMKEHIRDRLPPVERPGGAVMQTAYVVQIDTIPLQNGSKQINHQIGYQQIARDCR